MPGRWKTRALISALHRDRVIDATVLLIDGLMNTATFAGDTEIYLATSLPPGDAVARDNLDAHEGRRS